MTRTIICPYCQRPQLREEAPRETSDDVPCDNCGRALPRAAVALARPRTILWIDDDRLLLSACCPVLEAQGYRTLLATDEDAGVGTMGKKTGATTALRKPFGLEYIVEFLAKVLGRQPGPPKL
jgi:hypothetical protein